MPISDDPEQCLIRAKQERRAAEMAPLENVRVRHLAAAQAWEELGSRIELMIAAGKRRREAEYPMDRE